MNVTDCKEYLEYKNNRKSTIRLIFYIAFIITFKLVVGIGLGELWDRLLKWIKKIKMIIKIL